LENSKENQIQKLPFHLLHSGQDSEGQVRSLGISAISFKLIQGGQDGLLIIENTFNKAGGPARHLHFNQDEWFYSLQGEFLFEIGSQKMLLKPGDSVLAPRQVAHVWAFSGSPRQEQGRILIAFLPAGKMEAFFRKVTQANAMPPQDPALWLEHGMQLLGPPLKV